MPISLQYFNQLFTFGASVVDEIIVENNLDLNS